MNGWMWRPAEVAAINRQAPRAKGGANRARNRPGWPAWADRPRPVLAQFGPVSLPEASRSIVDLLPYACGPLTLSSPQFRQSSLSLKLQHLLSRSLEFSGFMLRSLGPLESCSWGVLCRASWSSLEVLDELIPKVSSLTLISCVNNKLQNRHVRVNLIPPGG
jgi:hypothetical protein